MCVCVCVCGVCVCGVRFVRKHLFTEKICGIMCVYMVCFVCVYDVCSFFFLYF